MPPDGGPAPPGKPPPAAAAPVNVWDYERLAEAALPPDRYGYFAGGAGDEHTLRDNIAAYTRWHLRPRVLVDVSGTTPATTVLGTPVSMPLLVAPFSFHRLAHSDGEVATARAAAAAGTVMCFSMMATATPLEVATAAPNAPRWFQLYAFRDAGLTRAVIEQAIEARFDALVLTVDTPRLGRRERDLRTGFRFPPDMDMPVLAGIVASRAELTPGELVGLLSPALSWCDVADLASAFPLPLLVKGILTAEDARLACEHGVAGVVVSNHGGRQLDGVPASLDALPEVVEAVDGQVEVLVDGGIRRGTDVVKALALGARAALTGRAVLWALVVAGEEGVLHVLQLLQEEIRLALALIGCTSPDAVTPAHVAPARG